MAYITITVNASNLSVNDANGKLRDNTNPDEGMNQLEDLINAVNGRNIPATVTVTVTTSDPAVTPSGGGGQSVYNKN